MWNFPGKLENRHQGEENVYTQPLKCRVEKSLISLTQPRGGERQ